LTRGALAGGASPPEAADASTLSRGTDWPSAPCSILRELEADILQQAQALLPAELA